MMRKNQRRQTQRRKGARAECGPNAVLAERAYPVKAFDGCSSIAERGDGCLDQPTDGSGPPFGIFRSNEKTACTVGDSKIEIGAMLDLCIAKTTSSTTVRDCLCKVRGVVNVN